VPDPIYDVKIINCGFTWGPLRVTRLASLPDGSVVVEVGRSSQDFGGIQVRVSRTGRTVRAFDGQGKELEVAGGVTPHPQAESRAQGQMAPKGAVVEGDARGRGPP